MGDYGEVPDWTGRMWNNLRLGPDIYKVFDGNYPETVRKARRTSFPGLCQASLAISGPKTIKSNQKTTISLQNRIETVVSGAVFLGSQPFISRLEVFIVRTSSLVHRGYMLIQRLLPQRTKRKLKLYGPKAACHVLEAEIHGKTAAFQ